MPSIFDVARLLQQAPAAAQLAVQARRAINGDPAAIEYMVQRGWHEALDLAVPGAGQMAVATITGARTAYETFRNGGDDTIEGEWREVAQRPAPYAHFTRWIANLRSGTVVFIGPKGGGKTAGAQRLAEVWAEQNGYEVDMVNFDPRDHRRLPWANAVTMSKFVQQMKDLADAWDKSSDDDEQVAQQAKRTLGRFKNRIVLIDEASLAIAPTGPLAGKTAARIAMNLSRHVHYLCIYIGQFAKSMPSDLFGSDAVFVRQPKGKEVALDRDDAVVRDLWQSAIEAFAGRPYADFMALEPDVRANVMRAAPGVTRYPWFGESPLVKSWAYVDSPGNYAGLVPFALPNGGQGDDEHYDEEDDE